jgi:hypothetical protein
VLLLVEEVDVVLELDELDVVLVVLQLKNTVL